MNVKETETENLFAYGTLQTEAVQLATFGRRLNGRPDALAGYQLRIVEIRDQDFATSSGTAQHRNLEHTGLASDFVEGTVITITQHELEQADAYEPADYHRVLVELRSGINAWVYVQIHQ